MTDPLRDLPPGIVERIRAEEIVRQEVRERLQRGAAPKSLPRRLRAFFEETNFGKALVTFFFVALLGGFLTKNFDQLKWARDRKFELLRTQIQFQSAFLVEISNQINRRKSGLSRLRSLDSTVAPAEFEVVWDEYFPSVGEWNTTLQGNRSRLEIYAGEPFAERFHTPTETKRSDSIHGWFYRAHGAFAAFRSCIRTRGCSRERSSALFADASGLLDRLNSVSDHFVVDLTKTILTNQAQLEGMPDK